MIAADDQGAKALVCGALNAARGHSVVIDAFDTATIFTDWLRTCGFSGERPLSVCDDLLSPYRHPRSGRAPAVCDLRT